MAGLLAPEPLAGECYLDAMTRGSMAAFLTLLLASVTLGCARTPPPNVLLIVVDTLRADRLGIFGDSRSLTPFLDEFATSAYVFRAAYAASSFTTPSVASLMTGRHPSRHGAVGHSSSLPEKELTLAELLRERGYATAGFTANILLRPERGYGQGFDHYVALPTVEFEDVQIPARGRRVNQSALAWLDGRETDGAEPFFLYLQYMEPHVPFAPSRAALEWVFGEQAVSVDVKAASCQMSWCALNPLEEEHRRLAEGVYDAEVFDLDAALRELFLGLERRGVLERTIVVVTSDHGEEFLEHGGLGHGRSLYDELIRVPLLIRMPGQTQRVDLGAVVSHVDLLPTLLAWVGAAEAPAAEGRDLAALLAGDGDAEAAAFAELVVEQRSDAVGHQRAVVTARDVLIRGTASEPEILAGPRRESHGPPTPSRLRALERRLAQFEAGAADDSAPDLRPLGAEEKEQLRLLGYLPPEPE